MTNAPAYYTKTVAFDEATEAIVREVVQKRGFPASQGFSLAVRTIIREWHATQSNPPVAQAARPSSYPLIAQGG